MGVKGWRARALDRTEWASVVTVERAQIKQAAVLKEEEEEKEKKKKKKEEDDEGSGRGLILVQLRH
jgi:ribosomal protein L12E/L44/L45/RPP1/RPP2